MDHAHPLQHIEMTSGLPVWFRGPPLDAEPTPSLLYLALSGSDSLMLDPFNQPVIYALKLGWRVFSCDLPAHGPGLDPNRAMDQWAAWFAEGKDPIANFLDPFLQNIEELRTLGHLNLQQTALAGLSRGGLIVLNAAARDPRLEVVVGYAPLTDLRRLAEVAERPHDPLMQSYAVNHLAEKLTTCQIRLYIGNRDQRVQTDAVYQSARAIVEAAAEQRPRKGSVDFIMTPSIGHKGHGTSPDTFRAGIEWIQESLSNREF